MILEVEHWYHGYSQILEDCRSHSGSVLILCHADVDALAAARILTYMLRADNVSYVLKPCPTFGALQMHAATGAKYAAMVLLNVGGTRNLTKLFGSNKLNFHETKLYVMDGRRPLHLANIHAESHVVVFWDPTCHGNMEDLPSDGDNLSGNDDDDEEDDESSSSSSSDGSSENELVDSDEEDEEQEMEFDADNNATATATAMDVDTTTGDENNPKPEDSDDYDGEDEGEGVDADGRRTPRKLHKKKAKKQGDGTTTTTTTTTGAEATTTTTTGSPNTQATDATHDLEDDDDDDDDDHVMGTDATHPMTEDDPNNTSVLPLLTPAQRHAQRMERLKLYYSHGNTYGSPCSFVAYRLASQLRFGQLPDLLWLGMIGVTDVYLQARLDVVGYASMSAALQEDCRKLFPPPASTMAMEERIEQTVHAEELLVGGTTASNSKTRLTFSQQGRIVPQTDLRVFLLRHSSLWQALQCSPYVSTHLQLWTKPGMQRLQEMLARMGYPLQECQQPYNFMKPSLRRQLYPKMAEFAEVRLHLCIAFFCLGRVSKLSAAHHYSHPFYLGRNLDWTNWNLHPLSVSRGILR